MSCLAVAFVSEMIAMQRVWVGCRLYFLIFENENTSAAGRKNVEEKSVIGKLAPAMTPALSFVNSKESSNDWIAKNTFSRSITGAVSIHRIYVGNKPTGEPASVTTLGDADPVQQSQALQKNSSNVPADVAQSKTPDMAKSAAPSAAPISAELRALAIAASARPNASETGGSRGVHENIRQRVEMLDKIFSVKSTETPEIRISAPRSNMDVSSPMLQRDERGGVSQLPQADQSATPPEEQFEDAQTCASHSVDGGAAHTRVSEQSSGSALTSATDVATLRKEDVLSDAELDSAYDSTDELPGRGVDAPQFSLVDVVDSEENASSEQVGLHGRQQVPAASYQTKVASDQPQENRMHSVFSSKADVAPESTRNSGISSAQQGGHQTSTQQLPEPKSSKSARPENEDGSARIGSEARSPLRQEGRIQTSRRTTISRSSFYEETTTTRRKTTSTSDSAYGSTDDLNAFSVNGETKTRGHKTTSKSFSIQQTNENVNSSGGTGQTREYNRSTSSSFDFTDGPDGRSKPFNVKESDVERDIGRSWSIPGDQATKNEKDTINILDAAINNAKVIKEELAASLKQVEKMKEMAARAPMDNLANEAREDLKKSQYWLDQEINSRTQEKTV